MDFTRVEANGEAITVVSSDELVITDTQSALDLLATVQYHYSSHSIVLQQSAICPEFFDLSTRVAGDIVQKFVNYNTKLAIVGDFSMYTSKSLKDFIYECNKGKHLFFVGSEEEAVEKLSSV